MAMRGKLPTGNIPYMIGGLMGYIKLQFAADGQFVLVIVRHLLSLTGAGGSSADPGGDYPDPTLEQKKNRMSANQLYARPTLFFSINI